jgi:hypothetical protein
VFAEGASDKGLSSREVSYACKSTIKHKHTEDSGQRTLKGSFLEDDIQTAIKPGIKCPAPLNCQRNANSIPKTYHFPLSRKADFFFF